MFEPRNLTEEEIEYLRCLHTTDRGPIGEALQGGKYAKNFINRRNLQESLPPLLS